MARERRWRHLYRGKAGWQVAVRRKGKLVQQFFPDRDHGGDALGAAMAWRDALLQRLPPATMIRRRYAPNNTGVIGVQLSRDRTRSGRPAYRYRATWNELNGRYRARSFSIDKYGARRAKALAVEYRRDVVKRLLAERRELQRKNR